MSATKDESIEFVNIHELHTKTPQVIERVEEGRTIVVTKWSKPTALLIPLRQEDILQLGIAADRVPGRVRRSKKLLERQAKIRLHEG